MLQDQAQICQLGHKSLIGRQVGDDCKQAMEACDTLTLIRPALRDSPLVEMVPKEAVSAA